MSLIHCQTDRRHFCVYMKFFIIFGCAIFITLSAFVYFIEKFDNVLFQVVIFMIVIFAEIAWVIFEDNTMKKKMIKNSNSQ